MSAFQDEVEDWENMDESIVALRIVSLITFVEKFIYAIHHLCTVGVGTALLVDVESNVFKVRIACCINA
jgi:hypothetical protein